MELSALWMCQSMQPAANNRNYLAFCRVLDWTLGYIFFFFLFILSIIQLVDMLQGAILYNMRFAKSLQVCSTVVQLLVNATLHFP